MLRKERKKSNRFISEVVASVVDAGDTYNHVFESDYYTMFKPRHETDNIDTSDIIEFIVENRLLNHEHKKVDVDLVYSKLKEEIDILSSKVIERESVSCLFLSEKERVDSIHGVGESESREKLFSLIKDEMVSLVTVSSEKVIEELPDTADWKGEFKRRDVLLHHTLLADEAALLDDCLNAYSHSVLVRGNDSIEMGKATLKGQPIKYKIELVPGGLEVLHKKKKKAYPLKRPMRDLMLSTIREMEAAGVGLYNDINFDAEFASPVFFVYNKAKYRLVCDYKDLNSVTKDSIYPLPHMDYIFENLGKSNDVGGKPTHFSILDLKSGYWQIPLEELSQKLAAVLLPTGIFRFICLPFGLKNAPAFFQRYMDQVLSEGLGNFCFVYIDDIVIFSNSFDSHIEHLNLVLQMLKESNLKCNVEKCHFCLSQLRVLGKVISGEGIAPDPDLIHAMVSFPSPGLDVGNLAKKKLKRFIAMVGYYRHHIKDFGPLTSDLSKLLRDDYVWDSSSWTQLEEGCFQNLKQQLLSSPLLLEYPDFNKEFFLQSDASKVGAGAVLFQLDSLGRRCVVSYASWLFNDTERRYNTTERELLGLVLSVRKWKPFFYHTKFYAETDHQPLVGYLKLNDPYGKIARWAAELAQFNFAIKYIKGETNIPADTLSRTSEEVDFLETVYSCDIEEVDRFTSKYRPSKVLAKAFSTEEVEVCTLIEETEETILLNKLNYSLPSIEEWKIAQKEDPHFGPYVTWIVEKRLPLDKELALEVARLADHYALDPQGILVYSSSIIKNNIDLSFRKCVPAKFRKIILSECHDSLWSGGHLGRDKTLDKVRSLYYFPRMDQFINLWIKSCPICLATKRKHPSKLVVPLGTIEVTSVWDLVSIDLWDAGVLSNRGNRYLLTVIDGFSKYSFAIPLKNKTAKAVASKLYKHVFSQFGYPKRLHSDNGTEFCNSVLEELCEFLDINKTHTTVYHPQGNAYAERIHQFFKNALTAFVNQNQRNWDLLIPALINVYLTTVHAALGGFSPSQVAFGRTFHTPTVSNCDDVNLSNSTISYALRIKFVLDRVQKVVTELLKEKAIKNLKISESKEKLAYSVGDKVGLLVEAKPSNVKSAKLFPRYSGPHKIVKITKDSKVMYLEGPQGKLKKHPVSISNVKPWPSRQVLLDEFDKYELIRNKKMIEEAKRSHVSVSKPESKKNSVVEEEFDIMGNPIYPVDSPLRNAKVKVSVIPNNVNIVPEEKNIEYDIMGNPIEEEVDFLEPMFIDGDLPPLEREIVQVQSFLLDEIIVYKVRSTRMYMGLGTESDYNIVYNNDFNICFIA
jgi:transposase InsO family protein